MKKLLKSMVCMLAFCLMLSPIPVSAAATTAEMIKYPGVSLSPDGSERAWTTDAGDKTNERLPLGYTIDMQAAPNIREPAAGEHYYPKEATGSVTIGKWVVSHSPGQCIHGGDHIVRDTFAGFTYQNEICHAYYNNGWIGYCVDCNQRAAAMLIYATEDTIEQIETIPASSIYVYLCPHCTHLEQGYSYQHQCIAISSNRYRVTYRPNAPEDSTVAGYMAPTFHMYDNSETYNGQTAEEVGYTDTRLRTNSYTSIGYVFTGWNTEPDGSGESFADEQEVLNLTSEENGTVKLYAQWKKSESSLLIDAAGGTYKGQSAYEQKQKYGTTYVVDSELLQAPAGYQVSFVTNGGNEIASLTTTKRFSHWEISSGFAGKFKDNIYSFITENGHKDRITASYLNNSFVLPDCESGNASLVGWYDGPDLEESGFVGKAGDEVTVDQDTVLYAKWEQLTLWAFDNYTAYEGSGAVDLKWEQKDGKSKYYRLYQSLDKKIWKEIFETEIIESDLSITESYDITEAGETYTVPYTGHYTLTANGGKGADYDEDLTGGKGGSVSAAYWLLQGDVLTVYPGEAGDGLTGGSNGNGADGGDSTSELGRGGGAATEVYLTRDGLEVLLLTAGGGGGANRYASGGDGGTGGGNGDSVQGADGVGAGGGGSKGGADGAAESHTHTEDCRHVHTGDAGSLGGCYTVAVTCGSTSFTTISHQGGFYWGNLGYDANGQVVSQFCVQCGSYECAGHYAMSYEYKCNTCSTVYSSKPSKCSKSYGYGLGCGMDEEYTCGYTEGQIIKAASSYGGTNYIGEAYGCRNQISQSGINDGDGSVTISSLDIGYLESNSLKDVAARDLAAPERIPSYRQALSGKEMCCTTIEEPKDNGTTYYHMAESYQEGTAARLATSNITENTLTSGVAGYYYYVDENMAGTAGKEHLFTQTPSIQVELTDSTRYLHAAAVDVAGNVGVTVTIAVSSLEQSTDKEVSDSYTEEVRPVTEQMLLQESEYVYPAGAGSYYVKADGETEHLLTLKGSLTGNSTNTYQTEYLRLNSERDDVSEWNQVKIPKVTVNGGDRRFANEELENSAGENDLQLLIPAWAEADRTNSSRDVRLEQRVTIDAAYDGKAITVYPSAGAELGESVVWSDDGADRTHGLVLIPDGKGPVIYGVEALENAGNIDMTEEQKEFVIRTTDEGSGVRSLTVTITNLDNHMTKTYAAEAGVISVVVHKDDYLFLGDFAVSVEAVDNVGNRTTEGSDKVAFTLEADIRRSREPYDGDYKAGDGAVLTVTTGGYADKVIIRFPEELVALNPGLDKEYVYEFPYAIRTEAYEFNIPLGALDGSYVIDVEAWKNGEKLTTELELPVITAGSITDEFRTRIRDNGV